ncbi:MAG: hypothetical protein IJ439_05010 [Tyzzerella sp.]|nr:hypothetical protein [Tyzzerella sp.]
MFTFFNSESLWIGFEMDRFNQIRDILDSKSIPYKYKVRNHLGQFSGRGTIRGAKGSFGNHTEQMYQYEILVYKRDFEQAKFLI